jgi:hypothetical protein
MDISYEIKPGYLYIKMKGKFVLADLRDIFFECVEKARSNTLNRLFLDITLIKGINDNEISTIDRFNVTKFIAEFIPKHFKLAFVETPLQLKGGRFGETVMLNRGANVKITSNYNEALEWLGVIPADEDVHDGK